MPSLSLSANVVWNPLGEIRQNTGIDLGFGSFFNAWFCGDGERMETASRTRWFYKDLKKLTLMQSVALIFGRPWGGFATLLRRAKKLVPGSTVLSGCLTLQVVGSTPGARLQPPAGDCRRPVWVS